jgi:hypothetical protein
MVKTDPGIHLLFLRREIDDGALDLVSFRLHLTEYSHRRMALGVQSVRRRPQAARPVGRKAVSGVALPQGVEG